MRGVDLNHRPPGYEPDELPDCSTPRRDNGTSTHACQSAAAQSQRTNRNSSFSETIDAEVHDSSQVFVSLRVENRRLENSTRVIQAS